MSLGALSSVWLGITTLTVLFIYMAVGSAGVLVPRRAEGGLAMEHLMVRQLPAFELTEYEWFHTNTFIGLCALLCVNLTVTTLRRIPFNLLKLGPWMIHSGVIVLALGSVVYFSQKVEGDTYILKRSVSVGLEGSAGSTFPALPGNTAIIESASGPYRVTVSSIDPEWPILSGDDQGKTAYAVTLRIEPPGGEAFFRQMLDGFPQYTEDLVFVPGMNPPMQRVKKLEEYGGAALVDESLSAELALMPQRTFAIKDTAALHWRAVPTDAPAHGAWNQLPIDRLPRYNDYASDAASLWPASGVNDALGRTLSVDAGSIDGVPIRIEGYLEYAALESRMADGGEVLDPTLTVDITDDPARSRERPLRAFHEDESTTAAGLVGFSWVEDEFALEQVRAMPEGGPRVRFVAGPGVGDAGLVLMSRIESEDGAMSVVERSLAMGEPVALGGNFVMTATSLVERPVVQERALIIPPRRRDRDVERQRLLSMVRAVVGTGADATRVWLAYHQYPFPSGDEAALGLGLYQPTRLTLPDGRDVEVMFSRQTRELPDPVVLNDFELTTHVGGFTGSVASIRDWTSHVVFGAGDEAASASIATNRPAEHGGLWFFQAYWDAPREGSAGLNYTGLGVTNREGVYTMLAGSCLTVLGLIYAFYVKPMIIRRRTAAALAAHEAKRSESTGEAPPTQAAAPEVEQPEEVPA
ncbi:MAG: hypothetical protein AAGI30_01195 [Planctomycetota bacterium]